MDAKGSRGSISGTYYPSSPCHLKTSRKKDSGRPLFACKSPCLCTCVLSPPPLGVERTEVDIFVESSSSAGKRLVILQQFGLVCPLLPAFGCRSNSKRRNISVIIKGSTEEEGVAFSHLVTTSTNLHWLPLHSCLKRNFLANR